MPLVVVGPRRARGARVATVGADDRSPADGALGARHSAAGAPARARPRGRSWPERRRRPTTPGSRSPRPTTTRSSRRATTGSCASAGRPRARSTGPPRTRSSARTAAPDDPARFGRAARARSGRPSATTGATRATGQASSRGPRRCAAGSRATPRRREDVAVAPRRRRRGDPPQGGRGLLRRCTRRRRFPRCGARSRATKTTTSGGGRRWRSRAWASRRRWRTRCSTTPIPRLASARPRWRWEHAATRGHATSWRRVGRRVSEPFEARPARRWTGTEGPTGATANLRG